jgi:hypothetical protein
MGPCADSCAQYSLRVFKPDGSHTTIVTPFSQTVAEIQCVVARKPGFVTGKGIHKMFVRERGLGKSRPACSLLY